MRNFCDNYQNEYEITETNTNRFAENYQFIASMRNTTVRNHLPMENEDFTRHSMDLSSWFAIGDIVYAKLNWYKRHNIEVLDKTAQTHLEYILKDDGFSGDKKLHGLRPKLDLIFNYNKRLITSFLTEELLANPSKSQTFYMESANFFYNLCGDKSNAGCAKFGYRSVIWRSVLDWLRKGELLQKEILTKYKTSAGRISATNYVWRILVVLHRFSVANGGKETESRGTERYMPFLDLIQKVYNENNDFSARFYEEGFSDERMRMAQLLFCLNYFNNWFHFIDIQYNVDNANRKNLETWEVLHNLFFEARDNPEMLRIRITTAGKAMHIPLSDFRWYATFHDEGDCPHVHMMAWSVKPGQAYLNTDGIRKIKSVLTYDIFNQEMLHFCAQMVKPTKRERGIGTAQSSNAFFHLLLPKR